jgi:hypothetical protein
MRYKIIAVFLIVLSSHLAAFSSDNTTDTDKTDSKLYDIIIGGSPGVYGGFNIIDNQFDKYLLTDENTYVFDPTDYFSLKICISIPFSFFYYLNNNVAIGFSTKFGVPLSAYTFIGEILELSGNLKYAMKFGKINSKFLIEFGLTLNGFLNLQAGNAHFDNFLLLGPEILLGDDYRSKKNFSYIFGGFFNTEFGRAKLYYTDVSGKKQEGIKDIIMFNVGVEFRFSYIYTKFRNE